MDEQRNENNEKQHKSKEKDKTSKFQQQHTGMVTRTKKRKRFSKSSISPKISVKQNNKGRSSRTKSGSSSSKRPKLSDNSDEEDEDNDISVAAQSDQMEADDESTITSNSNQSIVNQEERDFHNQHNELCEVCAMGGELLCCTTCNLVFHIDCVRPAIKSPPSLGWSCAYCVSSGLTGHKKDGRIRRRADQALREMAEMTEKIKLQNEEKANESETIATTTITTPTEKNGNDNDNHGEQQQKSSPPATPERPQSPNSDDVSSNKSKRSSHLSSADKRAIEAAVSSPTCFKRKAYLLYDSLTPREVDLDKPRSTRRVRRQPTLFDPQSCPASEWKSDGVSEWGTNLKADQKAQVKAKVIPTPSSAKNAPLSAKVTSTSSKLDSVSNNAKTPNQTPSKSKKVTTLMKYTSLKITSIGVSNWKNEGTADAPLWCNYCKDDKLTTVCCFCGCRVCFSKHDEKSLLICDSCDGEYHIFCLSPPLSSIPKAKTWYCPDCKPKQSSHSERTSSAYTTKDDTTSTSKVPNQSKGGSSKKTISVSSKKETKNSIPAPPIVKKSPIPTTKAHDVDKYASSTKKKKVSKSLPSSKALTRESSRSIAKTQLESTKNEIQTKAKKSSPNQYSKTKKSNSEDKTSLKKTEPKEKNEISTVEEVPSSTHPIAEQEKDESPEIPDTTKEVRPAKINEIDSSTINRSKQNSKSSGAVTTVQKPLQEINDKSEASELKIKTTKKDLKDLPKETIKIIIEKCAKDTVNKDKKITHKINDIDVYKKTTSNNSSSKAVDSKKKIDAKSPKKEIKNDIVSSIANSPEKVPSPQKTKTNQDSVKKENLKEPINCNDQNKNTTSKSATPPPKKELDSKSTVFSSDDTKQNNTGSVGLSSPTKLSNISKLKPQRSRSGRSIKRNSFHDEVEEGEQHLRSPRYVAEQQKKVLSETVQQQKKIPVDVGKEVDVPKVESQSIASKLPTIPLIESRKDDESKVMIEKPAKNSESTPIPQPSKKEEKVENTQMMKSNPITQNISEPVLNLDKRPPATKMEKIVDDSNKTQSPSAPETVASNAEVVVPVRVPRRKPGARECMQISRRFGVQVIPQKYMDTLLDYCLRGKVEHLIRMRGRLDEHSRMLEAQLAGLETLVQEKGELDIEVSPPNFAQIGPLN